MKLFNKSRKTYGILVGIISAVGIIFPSVSFAKGENFQLALAFNPIAYLSEVAAKNNVADDRAARIDKYFEKRKMPLAGYGEIFVRVAEKCDIDWRLLPAIGVRESSGGLHMMNQNPFGWGSAKIKFYNFEDAIETVSDNLCGFNPGTARYYGGQTTMKRLWYYNGTVMPSYPQEVVDIMDMF